MDNSYPLFVKDVYLNPGEFCFGTHHFRIRTLLGSCVSLILWHPKKKLGGMSHIILPERNERSRDDRLPGKFADESFRLFIKQAQLHKTEIQDYEAKIFGGAHLINLGKDKNIFVSEDEKKILESESSKFNIGYKNSTFIKEMLNDYNIRLTAENIGGDRHRKVFFTVWDGEVWMENPK